MPKLAPMRNLRIDVAVLYNAPENLEDGLSEKEHGNLVYSFDIPFEGTYF
jgi:hypothetical protein